MKSVLVPILLLFFVVGCVEVVEKGPEGTDTNSDFDINKFFDINGNIDTNQNGDTNQNIDVNIVIPRPPPGELTNEYCLTLENQTKIETCYYDIAIENLDVGQCALLTVLDKDGCFLDVGVLSQNKSDCFRINRETLRNSCLNTIGTEIKDISYCNDIINNEDLKASCTKTVYSVVDGSECQNISDIIRRENCIFSEALTQNNSQICALISGNIRLNVYYRDSCLDQFSSSFTDPASCALYFNEEKEDECFKSVAIKNSDVDTCKKISDELKQSNCINTVANALSDQSICKQITDQTVQQDCFKSFLEGNPDAAYCELILDIVIKKECYKDAGVASLNDEICDKILDLASDEQTTCYQEIAKETFDPLTCDKIYAYHFEVRDECFMLIALTNLDFQMCEQVHFGENYSTCFSSIAIEINNFGICDQMQQDYFINLGHNPKYGCYKDFAIEKSDTIICELISPTPIREECLDEINNGGE